MARLTRHENVWAAIQKPERLSHRRVATDIEPDVTIRDGAAVISVADAKYKRDAGGPRNPGMYQVIAYGTVLNCPRTYLLYPNTELATEHDVPFLNSPILVRSRPVDISTADCVTRAEMIARNIVTECQQDFEISLSTVRQPSA